MISRSAWVVVTALVVGSCGRGHAGGGGNLDTGIEGSTPLSELTDAQRIQACEAILHVAEAHTEFCKLEAIEEAFSDDPTLEDAEAAALCEDVYDDCVAELPEDVDCALVDETECEATVAQYETCFNESVELWSDFVAGAPDCDEATVESVNAYGESVDEDDLVPASCRAFAEICPDLIDFD